MANEFIHGKRCAESLIVAHFAFFQIDRDLVAVNFLRSLHQLRHFVLAEPHSKESVLGAVIGKNICK